MASWDTKHEAHLRWLHGIPSMKHIRDGFMGYQAVGISTAVEDVKDGP
ncbi:MAG: hypothetical protein LOY03_12435 [Cyclobacteriaceae bacterium]|nr:hypothetical protein [Cyclobacteriaceae bacterium]